MMTSASASASASAYRISGQFGIKLSYAFSEIPAVSILIFCEVLIIPPDVLGELTLF